MIPLYQFWDLWTKFKPLHSKKRPVDSIYISKTKRLSKHTKSFFPFSKVTNKTIVFFFHAPQSFVLSFPFLTPVKFCPPKTTFEVRLRSVAAHPRCLFANKVPSAVESWLWKMRFFYVFFYVFFHLGMLLGDRYTRPPGNKVKGPRLFFGDALSQSLL